MVVCAYCQKKIFLKFMMAMTNIRATDISKAINVSDSMVRKHLDGVRYCAPVDLYLIKLCTGINIKEYTVDEFAIRKN